MSGWKRNRLVANFLKSKAQARRTRPRAGTKRKPIFSLTSVNYQCHQTETAQNRCTNEFQEDCEDQDQLNNVLNSDSDEEEFKVTRKRRKRSREALWSRQLEGWDEIQPSLLQSYTISLAMSPGHLCKQCPNAAKYPCTVCSIHAFYYSSCCIAIHSDSNIYHFPEVWVDGSFILAPLQSVLIPLDHDCRTHFQEKITVVSIRGKLSIRILCI